MTGYRDVAEKVAGSGVTLVAVSKTHPYEAVLEAWWYISDAKGKTLKQQKFYATQKVGENFDEFVEAESKMLAEMSRDIVKALIKM